MEIRRFYGQDMEQGLEAAKAAMGPGAVILDAVQSGGQVEIFATLDTGDETEDFELLDGTTVSASSADQKNMRAEAASDHLDLTQPANKTDFSEDDQMNSMQKSMNEELELIAGYRRKLEALDVNTELLPEELKAELFLLRKSLRRELVQLQDYRQKREEQEARPDPVVERLQAQFEQLQSSLAQELAQLGDYRKERVAWAAQEKPATKKLQSELASIQVSLTEELTRLSEFRQRREALEAELDPQTSKRWGELNELQECLSRELSQLCEYRLQRVELDAESDPITSALQNELGDQQRTLADELSKMAALRVERAAFYDASDPRILALQEEIGHLHESFQDEIKSLEQYRLQRLEVDAELDPVTRSLHNDLIQVQSGLVDEVTELAAYREQRVLFDAEVGPATRSIQQSLTQTQRSLDEELEKLRAYSKEREAFDSKTDPRSLMLQSGFTEVQEALQQELSSLGEYRSKREAAEARLDPITIGLHAELTKLQGSLRSEVVQLGKQREMRAAAETTSVELLASLQTQQGKLQSSIQEELAALRKCHQQMRTEHLELQQSLHHEISELRGLHAAGEVVQNSDTDRLAEEIDDSGPLLKSELTHISEYRVQSNAKQSGFEEQKISEINAKKVKMLGLAPAESQAVLDQLPNGQTQAADWRSILEAVGSQFRVANDDIMLRGGVVVLLGATGVGKSSTAAKLAALYTQRHGPGTVAIISTARLQVGGMESIAKSMDVPLVSCTDADALVNQLGDFRSYKLVLVDTGGTSKRDLQLLARLQVLDDSNPDVKRYLVASATLECARMDEVVQVFEAVLFDGIIITKVDEATTLGPVMTVAMRHQLPIAYVCSGPEISRQIGIASKTRIVKNCLRHACENRKVQRQSDRVSMEA